MEYQLEERNVNKKRVRGVEVVGSSCGRTVCRLTSLDSMLDYPHAVPLNDSDDEDVPMNGGSRSTVTDTPSRMPLIWRGGGSELANSIRPGSPPPPSTKPGRTKKMPPVPTLITASFLIGYLLFGAWMFAVWERRSYLDGLYFAFTALTTIGLSDHIPWGEKSTSLANKKATVSTKTSANLLANTEGQLHVLALCIYILFGLVLVATAFSLVQEQVIKKVRQIAITLGVVKKEELPV